MSKRLPPLPPPMGTPQANREYERPEQAAGPSPSGKPKHKTTGKRFEVLNSFVDETLSTLCRGDVVVWLILYRDTRDGTARTAQSDLARRSGLSVRGVAKALRRLEKRGLLKVVYRGGLNRGMSRYRVLPLPPSSGTPP